jgi:hypothetical protein
MILRAVRSGILYLMKKGRRKEREREKARVR